MFWVRCGTVLIIDACLSELLSRTLHQTLLSVHLVNVWRPLQLICGARRG